MTDWRAGVRGSGVIFRAFDQAARFRLFVDLNKTPDPLDGWKTTRNVDYNVRTAMKNGQHISASDARKLANKAPGSSEPQPSSETDWHAVGMDDVWQRLAGTEVGLTKDEAQRRLQQFGPNVLPHKSPPSVLTILWRQFQSPLIYILLIAAVVSLAVGDYKDAGFIAAVLAINSLIGGYQEWQAEKKSRALQQLLHIRALVLRDGEVEEIDAEFLVPGDVVFLESGNRVPADLRLVTSQGLEVDESLLTGESLGVHKDAAWAGRPDVPAADRLNLGYAASIVVRGRAKGVVLHTGLRTMVGQLATSVMGSDGGKPPLILRMERFAHTIAYAVLAAVVVVSLWGIVVYGYDIHEMFLFGVALAVSAIPEGLPAALTVALAIATSRMARRGVIVRRLAAVEGLGSCNLIASDKTGTLTCNELTVREVRLPDGQIWKVTGEGFPPLGQVEREGIVAKASEHVSLERLARVASLCNEGDLRHRQDRWVWHGDPTDVALLSLAGKLGVDRHVLLTTFPQIGEIPFEPENQFSATFHESPQGRIAMVKGAPERILRMCKLEGEEAANNFADMAESMAQAGYRVLALAERLAASQTEASGDELSADPNSLQRLTFRGFVGMIDPLRPGARDAVDQCHRAGIDVMMITGDHPVTALAIARDLDLASFSEQVVTGRELEQMSPEELDAAVRRGRVFARVSPKQKLELVNAARRQGHYVAVTGDGVNDAPALRAANIGVAMGKSGTDVAREAAELVISDDNFATIVSGIEEGRVAYDNIRKVIYLLVSTGAAEVLLIGTAFAVGTILPLPLLAVQLLWLNLVTNGIQGVALAFEPGEEGVLRRPPRSTTEPIFDRLMLERTIVAAVVMAVVGTGAFAWMIGQGWSAESSRNALLLLMVLFENIHIGNCRSETQSALRLSPFKSPFLLAGALGAFLLHVLAMHTPFLQSMLQTEPVNPLVWLSMFGLALTVFIAIEIHKWIWSWRFPRSAMD